MIETGGRRELAERSEAVEGGPVQQSKRTHPCCCCCCPSARVLDPLASHFQDVPVGIGGFLPALLGRRERSLARARDTLYAIRGHKEVPAVPAESVPAERNVDTTELELR